MRSIDNMPKGTGRRHEDRWSLPVCRPCHNAIHRHGNDEVYLASRGIDGRALAQRLWSVSPDFDLMERAVLRARSEEHTSELPSLMRKSYAVLWLTKKTK